MSAWADRLRANATILKTKLRACCCCLPCGGPVTPVQGLDVRVRDAFAGGAPVANAVVSVIDTGGVHPPVTKHTDNAGDVIFFPLPAGGNWDVEARKEWFLPEPAQHNAGAPAANSLPAVPLNLEELRYYLHVDADRDGDVDDQHEGLNVITPWQLGSGPTRRDPPLQ